MTISLLEDCEPDFDCEEIKVGNWEEEKSPVEEEALPGPATEVNLTGGPIRAADRQHHDRHIVHDDPALRLVDPHLPGDQVPAEFIVIVDHGLSTDQQAEIHCQWVLQIRVGHFESGLRQAALTPGFEGSDPTDASQVDRVSANQDGPLEDFHVADDLGIFPYQDIPDYWSGPLDVGPIRRKGFSRKALQPGTFKIRQLAIGFKLNMHRGLRENCIIVIVEQT